MEIILIHLMRGKECFFPIRPINIDGKFLGPYLAIVKCPSESQQEEQQPHLTMLQIVWICKVLLCLNCMRFLFLCKCYIYILRGLVSSTVCRIKMKSANSTVSYPSLDLYVAILAETCTPGILDEPVILSFMSIMTLSYHSYFMVQVVLAAGVSVLLTASAVIVNTVIVVVYVISL